MTTKPAPIPGKDRQKALRARKAAAAGGPEVRGIYAPLPLHPPIKEAAADIKALADKLARKRARTKDKTP